MECISFRQCLGNYQTTRENRKFMDNKPFNNIVSALLSMKSALGGMITSSLRAVTVNLDMEKEIYICRFFYDGPNR